MKVPNAEYTIVDSEKLRSYALGSTPEVEFVAQDGYTYALVTLPGAQLIPLREKSLRDVRELPTIA